MKENIELKKRTSIKQIEEGTDLAPKFNDKGLIPTITIDADTKEVLMFSYMNEIAFKKTITTKLAHYWSRSRSKIWKKGEESGMYHNIKRILIDDDQDSLILEIKLDAPTLGGDKASCHVGYYSCFYREIIINEANSDPNV